MTTEMSDNGHVHCVMCVRMFRGGGRRDGDVCDWRPHEVNAMFKAKNPMIGRRCVVRTYSAGVHIGTVVSVDGKNVHLIDALRLWRWTGGALSLSAVAMTGITGGRLNRTSEVWLTEAIELIPTTPEAEATYAKFIE